MTSPIMSVEAEQAVIGGVLLDNRAWRLVGQRLKPEMFFHAQHADIVAAIAALSASGAPFDLVTVSERLNNNHASLSYLTDLARNTPSAANVEAYADIVADRYTRRQIVAASVTAESIARKAASAADALSEVRSLLDGIDTHVEGGAHEVHAAVEEWVGVMHERRARNGGLQGITTGFQCLDKRWFGLCAPDLIILAGRPSMGKTTLGMNIAEGAAAAGHSVLVYSLEMSQAQLMDRRIASVGKIPLAGLRDCNLEQEHWDALPAHIGAVKSRRLMINDSSAMTIDRLRLSAAAHKASRGLDLVVVDYLGLLDAPGAESRLQEVRMISKGLKRMAKELEVPVLALCQLNRKSEDRANKRPMMADLRESGDIEQDADIIAFVHRQEKYEPENDQWKGVAEIITEKHRNGEVGTDFVRSELAFARFVDADIQIERPVAMSPRAVRAAAQEKRMAV